MKEQLSHSLEETRKIAHEWLNSLMNKYRDSDGAIVVGLSGHLGAGKTAFVKMVAKELGIQEEITSPTFVIMKIYNIFANKEQDNGETISRQFKKLIHIDAYRLEHEKELAALNFEKLIEDKNNLIMIEWPENVLLNRFKQNTSIYFEIKDKNYSIVIQ